MDENLMVRGYFNYAFSHLSRYTGQNSKGENLYIRNVFEADVSPLGSIHDRACDLYQ
jgi:hypothetical protein